MQVKITLIHHMAYHVAGVVAETREFYTRLLGLSEIPIQFPAPRR